jgi:2',3'-cyclic-nucleotide 2'-phosphodiesterase (5'-nucleotidase family)
MNQRGFRVFWVAVLVLGLAVFSCAQTSQPKKLTILHTNDTHSAMVPFETGFIPAVGSEPKPSPGVGAGLWDVWQFPFNQDYAGIARMATLIKKLRAADKNVLALNAGDVFVGSFEFNKYLGYPELKIMENLYDAMELGNHEFDLGVDALAGILSGQLGGGSPVNLPVLCANMDFSGLSQSLKFLKNTVKPSIIRSVGGIKVGIFGLTTQEPQNYSDDVNKMFPYPYDDPDQTKTLWAYAANIAGGLKNPDDPINGQCDVVICVSHLGTYVDVNFLAAYVPYIDVIIGGHSHDAYAQPYVLDSPSGGKVIIVQAGDFGKYLGELKLNVDSGGVTLDSWVLHRVDGRVKEDPKVRTIVNQVRAGVVNDPRFGPVYSQIIALALRDVLKSWPANGQNRDTPLGNLVTDAFMSRLKKAGLPVTVDCALDVLGYLGADIWAGKVVGNNILRSVPYGYDQVSGLDFKVVVVPLPGSLLLGGLEYAADMVTLTPDLAVQGSGITYTYDSSKPPVQHLGEISRVDPSSVKVKGEAVYPENLGKLYYVAMSEQVFNFLNALTKNPQDPLDPGMLSSFPTGLNEYTIVRDYMKSLRFVHYKSEGRIKDTAGAMVKK